MLYTAFLLGLAGSVHCLGMCGPIALALPASKGLLGGRLLYHLGRTAAYASIGLAAGGIGEALVFSGFQQYLGYASGALMVAVGLFAVNLDAFLFRLPAFRRFYEWVASRLGEWMSTQRGAVAVGFLNGFLPCGLVYMALFGALASGGVLEGAAYMAVFGMGTLPLMLAGSLLGQLLKHRWRQAVRKAYPVLFVALGLLFMYRAYALPAQQGRDMETEVICR